MVRGEKEGVEHDLLYHCREIGGRGGLVKNGGVALSILMELQPRGIVIGQEK